MRTETTEDEIRTELSVALAGLRLAADSRMGAGSDDVEGPREYLRALAPGGWVVPSWPVEFGGRGASPADGARIKKVLADFPGQDLYPFMVGLYLVGPSLLVHGTEDQKKRWLEPIADGSAIWCQMFSEPSAGSAAGTMTPSNLLPARAVEFPVLQAPHVRRRTYGGYTSHSRRQPVG